MKLLSTVIASLNLVSAHTGPLDILDSVPQELTEGTQIWDTDKDGDNFEIRFQFKENSFSENFKNQIRESFKVNYFRYLSSGY